MQYIDNFFLIFFFGSGLMVVEAKQLKSQWGNDSSVDNCRFPVMAERQINIDSYEEMACQF